MHKQHRQQPPLRSHSQSWASSYVFSPVRGVCVFKIAGHDGCSICCGRGGIGLHRTDAIHGRGISPEIKKCESMFLHGFFVCHIRPLSLFAGVRNDLHERVSTNLSISPTYHKAKVHLISHQAGLWKNSYVNTIDGGRSPGPRVQPTRLQVCTIRAFCEVIRGRW